MNNPLFLYIRVAGHNLTFYPSPAPSSEKGNNNGFGKKTKVCPIVMEDQLKKKKHYGIVK